MTEPFTDERHPLDVLAEVECPHTRHYAMCAPCAADAVRQEVEQIRTELWQMTAARDVLGDLHKRAESDLEQSRWCAQQLEKQRDEALTKLAALEAWASDPAALMERALTIRAAITAEENERENDRLADGGDL